MFSLRFPSIFAAALLLSACGPSTADLGPRAATDLSCAPEKISIQGDHVWVQKASGCGKETVYLSSADWMERNFFKRIELALPILDPKLKRRVVTEGLKFYLADNQQGWEMNSQGTYQRRRSPRSKPHNAQGELMVTLGSGT